MTALFLGLAIALGLFAAWSMRSRIREEAGPRNNWENEDFMSREMDGTWAEGSTQSSNSTAPSDPWGGNLTK